MEEIKQQTLSEAAVQNTAIDISSEISPCLTTDFICLSHLRWDFVYQRPQHLLSRFAKYRRVFFVEEPIFEDIEVPRMDISRRDDHLHVVVPRLPKKMDRDMI